SRIAVELITEISAAFAALTPVMLMMAATASPAQEIARVSMTRSLASLDCFLETSAKTIGGHSGERTARARARNQANTSGHTSGFRVRTLCVRPGMTV